MHIGVNHSTNRTASSRHRHGMALLLCLFVVFMVSSLLLAVVNTETVQYSAIRNVHDYERALYLANAGVHHVCAELEADSEWRGTVADGNYPGDDSYTATAVDGAGGNVDILATGVSGAISRTIEATVEL